MQVAIESTSNLGRRMKVSVPAKRVQEAIKARLAEVAKSANVRGFRPGMVSPKVAEMRFGHSVRQEVLGNLMRETYFEALKQEKVKPAGMPNIKPLNEPKEGIDFEYEATFEVYPEVVLADLTQLKIEKPVAQVSKSDIDKMLETIRKQHSEWRAVTRAAKKGDKLKIDFVGTIDGKSFEGGEAKDFELHLGEGAMLPDFEKPLENAKSGDEIEFDLKFPENYHGKEVAGKTATFKVKVHNVLESKLPELDDKFAKQLKVKDGIEGLREKICENMERTLNNALQQKLKETVMDQLIEANKVELPQSLIDLEIQHLRNNMVQQFQKYNLGQAQLPDFPPEYFEKEARQRVELGLILAKLIEEQELKADANLVRKKIEEFAASYQKPEEVVAMYYNDKNKLTQVESIVLEEQAVDYILTKANVVEKKLSYDEAVNPKEEDE